MRNKIKRIVEALLCLILCLSIVMGSTVVIYASEETSSESDDIIAAPRASAVDFTVENIINSGIIDSNFAKAVYNSVTSQSGAFLDGHTLENNPYSTMEELLNHFNGEIQASGKGIEKIDGISMLKSCTSIDISFNKIENIKPISVTDALTAEDVPENLRKYYGTKGKATIFNVYGNPIHEYPAWIGGRVEIKPELTTSPVILEDKNYVFVLDEPGNYQSQISIPLNLQRGDETPVFFAGELYDGFTARYIDNNPDLVSKDVTGANLVTEIVGPQTEIAIKDITNSGSFVIQTDTEAGGPSAMGYYNVRFPAADSLGTTKQSIGWLIPINIKIYTKVEKDNIETKHSVSLTKLGLDDGEIKTGAAYSLYKKTGTEPDPENDKKVSEEIFKTGADGKISVSDLAAGNYYFLESTDETPPSGYGIDLTPVEFTLDDGSISITNQSGNGSSIDKGDGTNLDPVDGVYALGGDPDDVVSLSINPPADGALESLTLTWTKGNQGGSPGTMKYVVGNRTEFVEGVTFVADMDEAVSKAEEQLKNCHELYQNVKVSASFTQNIEREHKDPLVPAKINLDASKKLLYNNGEVVSEIPAGKFTFTLENDPEYLSTPAFEEIITAKNKADGTINFDEFEIGSEITVDAANKTPEGHYEYHYLMKEVNDGDPNYQYDDSVYKVTVTIGKNEDTGFLEKKSVTFTKDETEVENTAEFKNILQAVPFRFKKIDGDTKEALSGVKFALYKCKENHATDDAHSDMVTNPQSGCWSELESAVSDNDGIVGFTDLKSGDYQLVEVETNARYELPLGQWRIHVDAPSMIIDIQARGDYPPPAFIKAGEGNDFSYELPNYKKKVLPMAGGIGSLFLTGVGASIITLALILLFALFVTGKKAEPKKRRKRMFKNKLKKLCTLVAAVCLTAGTLASTAFAAGPTGVASLPDSTSQRTLTIHKYSPTADAGAAGDGTQTTIPDTKIPLENVEFDIYKIPAGQNTSETPSEAEIQAIMVPENLFTTMVTDENGEDTYSFGRGTANDGRYLVVEKDNPAVSEKVAPFYVSIPMTNPDGNGWLYDVHVYPKNDINAQPLVNKDVSGIDNKSDTADMDNNVTWIIRGDVPKDLYYVLTDGTEVYAKEYKFTDPLDTRLTYKGNLEVKVYVGQDAGGKPVEVELLAGDDYTAAEPAGTSGGTLEVKLTDAGMKKVMENLTTEVKPEIRVYFDTVINNTAKLGVEIENNVNLDYTNSVGNKFDTVDVPGSGYKKPAVHTGGTSIDKYEEGNTSKKLKGAKFQVAREATQAEIENPDTETKTITVGGVAKTVVYVDFYTSADAAAARVFEVETDDNGAAVIRGLAYGNYYLIETQAPEVNGVKYNLLTEPMEITINESSHLQENSVKVPNNKGFTLPKTGGMGTTLFTVAGIGILALAIVLIVTSIKKKKFL